MFEPGEGYTTRCGYPVAIYRVFRNYIHGATQQYGAWFINEWDVNGKSSKITSNGSRDQSLDIMPKAENRKVWAVLWKSGRVGVYQERPSGIRDLGASAKQIDIEFTIGEGLCSTDQTA